MGIWRDARNENLGTNLLGADRLLGCDPEVATRRDCERYGIEPIVDAGAYGFARVRGGGVVDLRRPSAVIPLGAVVELASGRRVTIGPGKANSEDVERFIGLDVRLARPEDVTRFACRAKGVSGHTPDGGPIYSWCSLAYGEHPEHEDLATGAKWTQRVVWTHIEHGMTASVSTGLAALGTIVADLGTGDSGGTAGFVGLREADGSDRVLDLAQLPEDARGRLMGEGGAVEQTLDRNEAALCRIDERIDGMIRWVAAYGGNLAVEMSSRGLLEVRAILLGAEPDKASGDPGSVLGGLLRERFRTSTAPAASFFAETPDGWAEFGEFLREWVRRERERVPGPEGEGR